ncbi:MAG: hypothetical protein IKQ25_03090 [Lachnospiraceae bacterium]|nr:hypothetical protein [Lachnospiraceae bacterium]
MRRNDGERKDKATLLLEKKKIMRNFVLLLAASFVVLIAVLTMAWFAKITDVKGASAGISAQEHGFELATKGNHVRNAALFSKADNSYQNGVAGTDADMLDDIADYDATNNANQKIKLQFSAGGDVENEPGAQGEMNFYVIPKHSGTLKVAFSLNIRGFVEVEDSGTNEVTLVEIESDAFTTANTGLTAQQITATQEALRYLKGHIFFFEEEGDPSGANPYYYATPVTDNTFTEEFTSAVKNKLYPVSLYWIWPATIGQITLKDGGNGLREGIPIVEDDSLAGEDTDKGKIIALVKANKANIFRTDTTADGFDAKIENTLLNLNDLSGWYNDADQMIGTYVDYFLVEITAVMAN